MKQAQAQRLCMLTQTDFYFDELLNYNELEKTPTDRYSSCKHDVRGSIPAAEHHCHTQWLKHLAVTKGKCQEKQTHKQKKSHLTDQI